MHIEELRTYCLSRKGTTEDLPFDEHTLAFRVVGKIFALISLKAEDPFVNLKCDPDFALTLRDEYDAVIPGYHMNKKQWNSVYLESDLSDAKIRELIDHSYDLIVEKLSKAQKEILASL